MESKPVPLKEGVAPLLKALVQKASGIDNQDTMQVAALYCDCIGLCAKQDGEHPPDALRVSLVCSAVLTEAVGPKYEGCAKATLEFPYEYHDTKNISPEASTGMDTFFNGIVGEAWTYAIGQGWIESVGEGDYTGGKVRLTDEGKRIAKRKTMKEGLDLFKHAQTAKLFKYIQEVRYIPSYEEIASKLEIGHATIKRSLDELEEKGHIERE